ncbi:MAG: FmdB family zinc ribbon protein [Anaerolineae bacterium]
MPLYEYTCQECDEQFEKLVSFSAANQAVTCPNCHGTQCVKSISLFGSVRGSGGGAVASSSSSCAPSG